MRKWLQGLGALLSIGVFCLALFVLHRALGNFHARDVLAQMEQVPTLKLLAALCLIAGSYLSLGGFDWLALRHMGKRLPAGLVFLISFLSHAISHSTGFAALTGGAVRYRMYSAAGLTALEVGLVIALCGVTFGLGATSLAAATLILDPAKMAGLIHLPPAGVRGLGFLLAAGVAAYILAGAMIRRPLRLLGRSVFLPPPLTSLQQAAMAATDLSLAAGTLYLLLPDHPGLSYPAFIGVYVVAILAGLLSHVPGGLGVFETAMLIMLPELQPHELLGSLLIYRAFYNLLPLAIAAVVLGAYELMQRVHVMDAATRAMGGWIEALEPFLLSLLTFAGGVVLLFSAATPAVTWRLVLVQALAPPALVEAAHLLSGVAGAGLLLLARGIWRRLDRSWRHALLLLGVGIVATMGNGLDYPESLALIGIFAVLAASRPAFSDGAPLSALPFSPAWMGAAAITVLAALWLSMFAFKQTDLSVVGRFGPSTEAAQALRAGFAAGGVLIAALLLQLYRPSRTMT